MADTNTIHSLTSTLATIVDPSQVPNLPPSNHVAHVPTQPQPPPQQQAPPPVPVAPIDPNATPSGAPDSPAKRRPGRPKGSVKKPVDPNAEPKVKRPVGRPRKDGLPAGSVGPKRPSTRPRKRPPGTFASGAQSPAMYPYSATPFGDQWPGSISAPPMGTLPGRPPAQIPFPIDPSLDRDNWAELLRVRPDIFLHTLVSSLSAPNPLSVGGLSVEEAFKAHLASLATTNKNAMTPMIPTLYSLLKTFWLPMSPVYFSLTASASTSRTPSEHRFLYWDPHPLVFNGIACPACASPLVNKGRIVSGPLKIYDLGKPFFVIGCEYVCASPVCCPANTQSEGRKFASTDASILRALPPKLRDEFPARLLEGAGATPDLGTGPEVWSWRGMGVSVALWNMARASLRAGLRKDAILGIIRGIIDGVPDDIPWTFPLATPITPEPKSGIEIGQKDGENGGDGNIGGEEEEEEEEEVNGDLVGDKNRSNVEEFHEAWNGGNDGGSVPEAGPSNVNGRPPPPAENMNTNQLVTAQPPPPPPHPHVEYVHPYHPPPPPPNHQPYMTYPYSYPYFAAPHAPPSTNTLKRTFTLMDGQNDGMSEPLQKRVRHCVKCGSHDCKGKGGRAFCVNACQDCGKMECKGRNSKRPDRTCADAWP